MTPSAIPCDCCEIVLDESEAHIDSETGMHVCPECRRFLNAAKALLAQPCDGKGQTINLKNIHRRA